MTIEPRQLFLSIDYIFGWVWNNDSFDFLVVTATAAAAAVVNSYARKPHKFSRNWSAPIESIFAAESKISGDKRALIVQMHDHIRACTETWIIYIQNNTWKINLVFLFTMSKHSNCMRYIRISKGHGAILYNFHNFETII